MTEPRGSADEYDLKQCGRCAAWIPRTATMCAACQSTSPDVRLSSKPPRTPIGLPNYVTASRVLIAANLLYFVVSVWTQLAWDPVSKYASMLTLGRGLQSGLQLTGWYEHGRVFVGGEWWRILSATFLHSGLVHLAVNTFSLVRSGEIAEDVLGTAKFLSVYLVCGACSTLAITVWFVGVEHRAPHEVPAMVGASGAIFGLNGVLAAFLLRRATGHGRVWGRRIVESTVPMLVLGYYLPFVSNVGHVGGLAAGVLFGLFIRDRFSTAISPASRRNWWLLATVGTAAALVALGCGIAFTLRHLGAHR